MIVRNYLTQQQRLAEILNSEYEYGLSMLRGQKQVFWRKFVSIFSTSRPIVELMNSYVQYNNYIRALGLFLAVENEIQQLNNFDTQICKQANNVFNKIKEKLNRKQKILFQQKRISIYQRFQKNQKKLAACKRMLIQLKAELNECFSKSISQKMNAVYSEIFRQSSSKQTQDIDKEWLSFLNEQEQPNFTLYLSSKHFGKVVMNLLQQDYQGAWKQLQGKSKSSNEYNYYKKIITFIELRSFKELLLQVQAFTWRRVLTKHIEHLKRSYRDETGQEKIKDHLKCLQFYQSNKLFFSAQMALRGLIALLNLNYSYPNSYGQTQQKKLNNILVLCERLLSLKSQYCEKNDEHTQEMNLIFFFLSKKIYGEEAS